MIHHHINKVLSNSWIYRIKSKIFIVFTKYTRIACLSIVWYMSRCLCDSSRNFGITATYLYCTCSKFNLIYQFYQNNGWHKWYDCSEIVDGSKQGQIIDLETVMLWIFIIDKVTIIIWLLIGDSNILKTTI